MSRLLDNMTKYDQLKDDLAKSGKGQMKAFGNSMLPLLQSGSLLFFEKRTTYKPDDIVLSRIKGRWIDAHKIIAIGDRGFLIANNRGRQNGWTKQVLGKVIKAQFPDGSIHHFA